MNGIGYTTEKSDSGFLINIPVKNGVAQPDKWKFAMVFNYENWKGEWWTAMNKGNSFLHIKQAGPLSKNPLLVQGNVNGDGLCVPYSYVYESSGSSANGNWLFYLNNDGYCLISQKTGEEGDAPLHFEIGDKLLLDNRTVTVLAYADCGHSDKTETVFEIDTSASVYCSGSNNS